ncbi:MAG: tRNA preQ1(34) S-adenosylmethionine ribosyltransferase-isomerase QueA [Ruminococcaceae bacterium]|jgi:S-adenosylmethionine:tRNA ribosyltransferase-isomerase|nr:tRNA preQ1(34) S-adenosylmethionine ribosyltransferase-isomerase QueA [Oscillospiraceae bacterium]
MITNKLPDTDLLLSDFHYDLPEDRIAQTPAEPRDSSRLMVLNRADGSLEHRIFRDIIDYLRPTDTLVVNDTRVIPARIVGHRILRRDGTGAQVPTDSTGPVELLLLKQRENDVWETLAGPGKRAKPGDVLDFGDGILRADILEVIEGGCRLVRFTVQRGADSFFAALDLLGTMPLPPYITEKLADPERYQTVYSKHLGSAAAPTAGLHFTPELLDRIRDKGIEIVPVLLHVGLGTFRPVKEDRIADHEMHSEYIRVTEEAAETVNRRRAAGGRVIAVGTTSCRVLESAADENGILHPVSTDTGIFIYPGYRFRIVDALITNFHLPESTLLMLVSALAGRETILRAYRTAVEMKYRFFSFGDAMFIQ